MGVVFAMDGCVERYLSTSGPPGQRSMPSLVSSRFDRTQSTNTAQTVWPRFDPDLMASQKR
jgi:hypothetical protein